MNEDPSTLGAYTVIKAKYKRDGSEILLVKEHTDLVNTSGRRIVYSTWYRPGDECAEYNDPEILHYFESWEVVARPV